MAFQALEGAIQLVAEVRALFAVVKQVDRDLADQMRRAMNSVGLNLGEGARRMHGDRLHCWRIADGSAKEVETAIRMSVAWGYLTKAQAAPALKLLDRELAMLWKLSRR